LNPFTFHTGFEYSQAGQQWKGACVFCSREDHFYFNEQHLWDCKVCKRKGNLYTFIQQFHQKCTGDIQQLIEARGIPENYFRIADIRFNPYLSQLNKPVYVIPTFNDKSHINNLYKVTQRTDSDRLIILGTPTLDATMFNFPTAPNKEVWLCEGHWDKLAAEAIIGGRNITCIGFPGNWKATWTRILAGRDVVIFGDNDDAGRAVNEQIIARIKTEQQKPTSIRVIRWPEGTPDKYDLNDLWREQHYNAYDYIQKYLDDANIPSATESSSLIVADPSCKTFDDLVASCIEPYYFTPDMELLLLAMLTALYSLRIEGEQLWIRVIGPPGSSKTTLASLVGTSDQAVMRDTITGLLSGWKDELEEDASLIPLIAGKALIVKDSDALMEQTNITQILAQMRAFYDKSIAVTYLNRRNYEYNNIRSSFILCGTPVLRGLDNTALGERFIDLELNVTDYDRAAIQDRVIDRNIIAAQTGLSPETTVLSKAKGFIDHHLLTTSSVAKITQNEKDIIKAFGNLISFMRAKVIRNNKGEISIPPRPEVPSRITAQLLKVYQCAPIVLGKEEQTPLVHRLIANHTRSIINPESNRYIICEKLYTINNQMTGQELQQATNMPIDVLEREVQDMLALKMLIITPRRTSSSHMIRAFGLTEVLMQQFSLLMKNA